MATISALLPTIKAIFSNFRKRVGETSALPHSCYVFGSKKVICGFYTFVLPKLYDCFQGKS